MKPINSDSIQKEDLKLQEVRTILLAKCSLLGCWKTLEALVTLHDFDGASNIIYRVESINIKNKQQGCVTILLENAIMFYNKIKFV